MCRIMDGLQTYVPTINTEESVTLPHGDVLLYTKTNMWETLFGGDQLTVARARGSKGIRANSSTAKERLEGLLPVVEDWHSRMTFVKVKFISNHSHICAVKVKVVFLYLPLIDT